MYKDDINTNNKIITTVTLKRIFNCLNDSFKKYMKISEQEKRKNQIYETSYQNFTFKNESSHIKANVSFYDKTNIIFDNFDNFISVFNSRADEIKSIYIFYCLRYSVITPKPEMSNNYYSQDLQIDIRENGLSISYDLSSEDNKLDDVCKFINNEIRNAPPKYGFVIKKKSLIKGVVTFGSGLIPGIILATLTLFIPQLSDIVFRGYVLYPIFAILLAYLFGTIFYGVLLDNYYKPISPNKKHVGYSKKTFNAIYKDDIEDYIESGEVIIGKNINNIKARKEIKKTYLKFKSLLYKELVVLVIASIIVIIIGLYK